MDSRFFSKVLTSFFYGLTKKLKQILVQDFYHLLGLSGYIDENTEEDTIDESVGGYPKGITNPHGMLSRTSAFWLRSNLMTNVTC